MRCLDEMDGDTDHTSPFNIGTAPFPLRSTVQTNTLLSCSLVSRCWRTVAQHMLFRRLESSRLCTLEKLVAILTFKPDLASVVATLYIAIMDLPQAKAFLSALLPMLRNLRAYFLRVQSFQWGQPIILNPFLPGHNNQSLHYFGIISDLDVSLQSWDCPFCKTIDGCFPSSLRRIDVHTSFASTIPFPKLPNLTDLRLTSGNARFISPAMLEAWPSLKSIRLEASSLQDVPEPCREEITHMKLRVFDVLERPLSSNFKSLVHLKLDDYCFIEAEDIDWFPHGLQQISWTLKEAWAENYDGWVFFAINEFLRRLCSSDYLPRLAALPEIYMDARRSYPEATVSLLTLELAQKAMEALSKRNLPNVRNEGASYALQKRSMFRIFPPRWMTSDRCETSGQ